MTTGMAGLKGLRVAAFETQRAHELEDLIRQNGGKPVVAPALREVPLRENGAASRFVDSLIGGQIDVLVLLTGIGTRALLETLEKKISRPRLIKSLKQVILIARGPKPVSVLKNFGLVPRFRVREPGTWREIMSALEKTSLKGLRIAVQEPGVPNLDFLNALEARGAQVIRIPLYRWSLPKDPRPLQRVVRQVMGGEIDVLLFTNATQVNNVFQVANEMGEARRFQQALGQSVVASIGPNCRDRLDKFRVSVDVEASRPELAALMSDVSRRSRALLARKRNGRGEVRVPEKENLSEKQVLDQSLFLRACRRERTERTPIWLMRQAGRYMKNYRDLRSKVSMLELCKHPDLAAEVTVDAVKQLGVDAAIIFSDLLLIVETWGFKLEYAKGEGPVIRPAVRSARDVDRVQKTDIARGLDYVFESLRKTRAMLPGDIPLIGFAGAPFTLASYLIEGAGSRNFIHMKAFMYREPKAWHRLLSRISESLIEFLNLQIRAGAQAVQLFDSWVGCLSPADYREYVLPHSRRVFRGIDRDVPTIHFGTQTGELLELMKEAGGTVLGVDWRIDLDKAWDRVGNVAVMGNLDPTALFASPKEIRAQAARILRQARGRRGHIFNLGHGILPETPVENVKYLVKCVKELSTKANSK